MSQKYPKSLKSSKVKQKFNQTTFDYKLFPKHVIKIFTDSLHGRLFRMKTKTDAIQLIVFLCFDGALIPHRDFGLVDSEETRIQSSQFELKLVRRCKNFLFGISGIETHGFIAPDGPEPQLSNIGYAACLFYFLSFQKPELSHIILENSKKTYLNSCRAVQRKWCNEKAILPYESQWTSSDIKMLEFIKDKLDDMHGNSNWIQIQLKKITKIFNEVHKLVGLEDSKLEAIDKLYGIDDTEKSSENTAEDQRKKIGVEVTCEAS